MGDYKPGDQISREQAWKDLKENFTDFPGRGVTHTVKDIVVNLFRIAGVSDRDKSQEYAMFALGFIAACILWTIVLAIK